MRRREFMALLASAVAVSLSRRPLGAQQQPARIALLGSGAAQTSAIFVDALRLGLSDNGLVEGRDYLLDVRWAEGEYGRFPALAREAVSLKPNVILVTTIAAVRAAQRATSTVPIVMTSINDPVGAGLIESLARPGRNTTGLANLTEDLTPKVLEIALEVVPRPKLVAALFNPANPSNTPMIDSIRARAGAAGAVVESYELKRPGEIGAVFAALARPGPDALMVINDATIIDQREQVAALALQHRIPAFSSIPELTDAGGLAGYGTPRADLYRRSAFYVRRILDGLSPASLPVEQPSRVELSINLRTAKALGMSVPDTLIARADRVLE